MVSMAFKTNNMQREAHIKVAAQTSYSKWAIWCVVPPRRHKALAVLLSEYLIH